MSDYMPTPLADEHHEEVKKQIQNGQLPEWISHCHIVMQPQFSGGHYIASKAVPVPVYRPTEWGGYHDRNG